MHPTIAKVSHLGQSLWLDFIRRGMIASGELAALIDEGVSGVTSNPTIFHKSIGQSRDYDGDLLRLIDQGLGPTEVYEALAFEDIRQACDLFAPVYRRTDRRDGFVSLEVPPALADDTDATVDEARRIHAAIARPNLMVKVPATEAGIPAIAALIGEGININVTLIFSTEVYRRVMGAYLDGLERLLRSGGSLEAVASVASFFVSRVDSLVDKRLTQRIEAGCKDLAPLLGKAAVANAKVAYELFKTEFGGSRFASLRSAGARVQRPLWASTSTKNPDYPDLLYVDNLIGPHTVNTLPPATLDALRHHGRPAATLEQGVDEARQILAGLEEAGIPMSEVTEQLRQEGVQLFADSFDELMALIDSKVKQGSGAPA